MTKKFLLFLILCSSTVCFAAEDALDEVNAVRVKNRQAPFIKDEKLMVGARACANFRAARRMAGHTSNDFSFLPPNSHCFNAGCAAWHPTDGWGSCCTYEHWKYAGAAYAIGKDGRRYMHLYVR